MDKLIYDFKGASKDNLMVYEDRIVISHTGVLNFFVMGIKGDKTIYYNDLTAVQFKKAGWTAGHIQFTLLGGRESVGGVLEAVSDENTITISSSTENEIAEKIVDYIQQRIREVRQPKVMVASAADEVVKLKKLLDEGVITSEEFNEMKKKVLGI